MVERYEPETDDMRPNSCGDWVSYEDYKALLADFELMDGHRKDAVWANGQLEKAQDESDRVKCLNALLAKNVSDVNTQLEEYKSLVKKLAALI